MIKHHPLTLLISAGALCAALGQVHAEEAAAPAPMAAPPPPMATPPTAAQESMRANAEAMRAAMEKRYAEAMAEREKYYEALRARATEVGMELSEMPPDMPPRPEMPPLWQHPEVPAPPGMGTAGMAPRGDDMPAPMSREEFDAMREQRWDEMRERAAEQGRELPETPPWKAAKERRQEMLERYMAYRATIEAMTDEQKEAIAALFGGAMQPHPMRGCGKPWRHHGGRPGYGMGPMSWPQAPAMPGAEAPAAQPGASAVPTTPPAEPQAAAPEATGE